jgi:5-methyltetrahydrofolate--homocysteine methyltransferase
MNALSSLLAQKEVLLADGATGTNLFEMGLSNGAAGELWCVEHPERVRALHQGFVDAGADVILTNSFSSNRFRFALHGIQHRVSELARAAAAVAREVADAAGRPVVVAGSMGPTGEMIAPLGERTQSEARAAFEEQAAALAAGGADVAWIETMYSEEELAAAIAAVDAVGLPYVATMTFDTNGRTMMGLTPEQAVRNVKRHGSAPLAFGANCGMGPAQLIDSIIGLARGAEEGDVLVAKGNAGLPKMGTDLHLHYDASPAVMADYACLARDVGARIIGGCCGTTATHLRSMAEALARRPRGPFPDHDTIETRLGPVKVVTEEGPRRRRRR